MTLADGILPPARGWNAYLLVTAAVAGAQVMLIEVLGSRVIGPYYGVSLFVWTSLITVTLTAVGAGYAVGGALADRYRSADLLYGLLLAAGLLTLPIPLLKPVALHLAEPLGLRVGALVSALLLLGPALFVLGCTTPCIVRLGLREAERVGRTVGVFYAVSTAGSVAGTVLAGFFLIPWLGVSLAFIAVGGVLIALAAGYFLLFRGKLWPAAALLLVFIALPARLPESGVMPDGTSVRVLHSRDSHYGNVSVVDFRHGDAHTRELMIDSLVQGGVDVSNGLSIYEYAYLLQRLPFALRDDIRTCLVIGLGAGIVPRWFHARGVATEVVDIDPAVHEAARSYFDFPADIPVHIEDARAFLANATKRYDVLVLDVFTGDTTPAHLLTLEAVRLMKARQAPGGMFAANLVGSLGKDSFMTASIARTLGAAYDNVVLYPFFEMRGEAYGNLVVIAYDGPPRPDIGPRIAREGVHRLAAEWVARALAQPYRLAEGTPAMLLTDDRNPLDVRDLWLKESVRRRILETTPAAVLLGALP